MKRHASPSTLFSLVLVLVLRLSFAQAGEVKIIVSSSHDRSCLSHQAPESTEFLLDPEETKNALKRYFAHESNPELWDAAIVNAGIRFCTKSEAVNVFPTMNEALDRDRVDKRAIEVIANYYRFPEMKNLIQAKIDSERTPSSFAKNLLKVQKLTKKNKRSAE